MVGGIATVAGGIGGDVRARLPGQHERRREGSALLAATVPDVRGADLTDLAASPPRAAGRPDMRHRWIGRLPGDERIAVGAAVAPHGREILAHPAANGRTVVLVVDQARATGRHRVVTVAARAGGRASPSARRVEASEATIGLPERREALEAAARLPPEGARPAPMGDRFGACPGPDPGAAPS